MRVISQTAELENIKKGCVLTIGNFDGVHIGHQAILSAAGRIAELKQTATVVMTFQPHPLSVLDPQKAPNPLMPLILKEHLLSKFGVGVLFVAESKPEFLGLGVEDFVEQFILKGIRPAAIVEGEDFNFGSGRTGSVHTLQKITESSGIEVVIVKPEKAKLVGGQVVEVSSTVIRSMIAEGKVADAAILLSRTYRLIGNIVPGKGKGRKLGFPTLNMKPAEQIIPAEGVYAGFVEIGENEVDVCLVNRKIPSVFSIGRTSTYGDDNPLLIEAHLLVKDDDGIAGRWMAMDFVRRIRDQQKFETEQKLSEQIRMDCQKAKQVLIK